MLSKKKKEKSNLKQLSCVKLFCFACESHKYFSLHLTQSPFKSKAIKNLQFSNIILEVILQKESISTQKQRNRLVLIMTFDPFGNKISSSLYSINLLSLKHKKISIS